MKRPHKDTGKKVSRTGDIKQDFTPRHLGELGAVVFAYNDLESELDSLFFAATNLPEALQLEVSTRIHGSEGRIAIIRKGAGLLSLNTVDLRNLNSALDKFSEYKAYRDAIVHARIFNAAAGIGLNVQKRGEPMEALISEPALSAFYDHLVALRQELEALARLLFTERTLNTLSADDPKRVPYEAKKTGLSLQVRGFRTQRQKLSPIPKFPEESELHALGKRHRANQIAALMGWFQTDFPNPQQRRRSIAHLGTLGVQEPPLALLEAERLAKKKD